MSHKENKKKNILYTKPEAAIRELIKLTRGLVTQAEKEEQALAKGDLIELTSLQHDKESLAEKYALASKEFRSRIEDFRGAGRKLLDELERRQDELNKATLHNNALIEQMYNRARSNTQETLLAAQEIGQNVHINMNGHAAATEQREGM